jgi:hypothetical protein
VTGSTAEHRRRDQRPNIDDWIKRYHGGKEKQTTKTREILHDVGTNERVRATNGNQTLDNKRSGAVVERNSNATTTKTQTHDCLTVIVTIALLLWRTHLQDKANGVGRRFNDGVRQWRRETDRSRCAHDAKPCTSYFQQVHVDSAKERVN